MSPTVESPRYKGNSTAVYKHPLIRSHSLESETISESSSTNDSDNSSSNNSSSISSANYNNNGSTDISSLENYHIGEGALYGTDVRREEVSVGIRGRTHIPGLIVGLSNISARNSDSSAGAVDRPSFPAGASVSLPTSTTALEYLLHRHGMSRESKESYESVAVTKEDGGHLGADTRGQNSAEMTKTQSTESSVSIRRKHGSSTTNEIAQQFFKVEPCLYTHRMYIRAAQIFECLKSDDEADIKEIKAQRMRQGVQHVDNTQIPEMEFLSAQEQVTTFELTFSALKFQTLFKGILDSIGFFIEFPNYIEDYSLVSVILYDFQSRKFQRRTPFPGEELDDLCSEVEEALIQKKTRLQSTFAKERIKRNAPSLEYLLPESVRNKDESKKQTIVYLWINQIKTEIEEMIEELKAEGFTELEEGKNMAEETGYVFRVDQHCPDLLMFPPHLDLYFKDTKWVTQGMLVQQDKSSCLAPMSAQFLLGPDQDVIHVNVGTAMTTAHLASLIKKKSPQSHIYGFGVDGPEKAKKAMKNLDLLGVKNTKIIVDEFLSVDPEEAKFKSVRVIMISANCSKSAISSPVQFIVGEGEDMRFLRELSKSDVDYKVIADLAFEHEKVIKHALKFPKVQAVVYSTRSLHEAENESVVSRVLEHINSTSNSKKVPFKVTPPVLPFMADEIDTGVNGVDGRYMRFIPSVSTNGCFVAVISREPDDPKDVARNTIARAKSKGLLGKAKSAPQPLDAAERTDLRETTSAVVEPFNKRGGGRKLKGTASAPEAKTGLRSKLAGHKSPAAIGARLYQAGLLSKMEQARNKPHKPEHIKVVKHPAPFR